MSNIYRNFKYFRGTKCKKETNNPIVGFNAPREPVVLPVTYEPMSQNRFILTFPPDIDIPSFCVRSTSRPNVRLTGNRLISWENMVITMLDPIESSITQRLYDLVISGRRGLQITLDILDSTGLSVSKWVITGRLIQVDWGTLNHASDDLTLITMELGVDNASLLY